MYFKQIDEIINGTKTQTRRIVKPGEWWSFDVNTHPDPLMVYTPSNRLKWQVGRDYAVSPGRGKPGVWVNFNHPCYGYDIWPDISEPVSVTCDGVARLEDAQIIAAGQGYQPLRIRLLEIRREPLQDISEDDARSEGCSGADTAHFVGADGEVYEEPGYTAVECYRDLWNSINNRASMRWDDNPDVWALTFEAVRS